LVAGGHFMRMDPSRSRLHRHRTHVVGLVGLLSICGLTACGSSSQDAGDAGEPLPKVTFTEVYAKVLTSCTSCHAGFIGQIDGLDMSTQATAYKNMVGVTASRCGGKLVVPKNAATSVLYEKVTKPSCGSLMPQNAPPLSQAQLDLVKNWIDEGALND
jgi:hypothetical protein